MNLLKKLLPFIVVLIFIISVFYYFQNNKSDFYFLKKLNYHDLQIILLLCIFYLLSEAIIFQNIVKFNKKETSLRNSFLVICTTYLCNTFVQFSGLGYRSYYLKKFKNIEINKFIILSIFIILVELLIFSILSLLLIFFFDFFNNKIQVYSFIYYLLITIIFFSVIGIFFHDKIFKILSRIKYINRFKYLKLIINFFINFDSYKFKTFIWKFASLFVLQFIFLFFIFLISLNIVNIDNSILFSLIVTMSTDLSFIFTFTPYAIGINETFIFFSSNNFDVKISEILYVTNIFRLSMFLIYSIFGLLNLYFFSRKVFK